MTSSLLKNNAEVSSLVSNDPAGTEVLNSDSIQTFAFMGNDVRIISKDGSAWFVAKDIGEALSIYPIRNATRYLDADEKGVSIRHTPGGQQEMTIISEAGLYSLILRSRKPEAKEFKRWVTHEVLPAINRQGVYAASPEAAQSLDLTAARLDQLEAGITRIEATLTSGQPSTPALPAEPLFTAKDIQPDLEKAGIIKPTRSTRLTYQVLVENGYAYKDAYGYHPSRWAENCKLAGEIIKRETIIYNASHLLTTVGLTEKGKARLLRDLQTEHPNAGQQTELAEAAE